MDSLQQSSQEDGMSSVDTNTNMPALAVDTNMSMKDQMICAVAATELRTIPITKHISLEPGILRCPICSFSAVKRKQFLLHMAHEGCPSQYNQTDYIAVMVQLVNHSTSDDVSASSSEDEAESGGTKDLARKRKKPERKKETHLEMKKCTFCDLQMAKGTQEYYAHLRTHLPEGFICIKCSFVAQHNHHLLFHWFSAHETYRPFKCQYRDEENNSGCKYRCISKSMLASHEKVHLQFYQYRCDTCDYKTRHKSSLKKHLESTSHVPQVVLNTDGTPNPDIIIDINSRKRGPRQKKDPKTPPGRKMSDDVVIPPSSDCKTAVGYQLSDTNSSRASQCGTPEGTSFYPTDSQIPLSNWLQFYKNYAELIRNSGLYALLYNSGNAGIAGFLPESLRDAANDPNNKEDDGFDHRDAIERYPSLDEAVVLRNNARNATITRLLSSESAREILASDPDRRDDGVNDDGHAAEKRSVMPKEETPEDKRVNDINRQVDLIDFNAHTEDTDEPFNLSVRKTSLDEATRLQTRPVVTSLLNSVKTRKDTRKRPESEELEESKSAKLKCTRSYEAEIPVFPITGDAHTGREGQEDCAGNVATVSEHSEPGVRNVTDDSSVNAANVSENAEKDGKNSSLCTCTYMCDYCELTFRNLIMYDEHMGYHDKTNPLQCRKCREEHRNFVCFFKHIGSRPH